MVCECDNMQLCGLIVFRSGRQRAYSASTLVIYPEADIHPLYTQYPTIIYIPYSYLYCVTLHPAKPHSVFGICVIHSGSSSFSLFLFSAGPSVREASLHNCLWSVSFETFIVYFIIIVYIQTWRMGIRHGQTRRLCKCKGLWLLYIVSSLSPC